MKTRPILGIDIGGSGIKGAPVDLTAGELATDRFKLLTPSKSTPKNVAKVVAEVVDHFTDQVDADAPIGITVPAVVTHGVTRTAANIDPEWLDCEAEKLLADKLGRPVHLLNDADAAGVCEAQFGAAQNQSGLVIVTTLGTGIGTALLHNGVLIPNSEFGHIEIDGKDAETVASSGVRDKKGLSYKEWAPRLQKYYSTIEALFWPELFVVGGGVSRDSDKFLPRLDLRTPIVPAKHRNNAGIIGAAWLAAQTA
ncbi:polyphosphate--glucose phosphotransferase [Granulicoccus phenolivorans]|uniref:polyphosphate--glucose phosphotransferase n=1 Tax=Granulicoccus phenolivorans TaxID=266854 RepID=UPI0003FAD2E9|nr:ROK family protein [Granulicoccus phenolivorans]